VTARRRSRLPISPVTHGFAHGDRLYPYSIFSPSKTGSLRPTAGTRLQRALKKWLFLTARSAKRSEAISGSLQARPGPRDDSDIGFLNTPFMVGDPRPTPTGESHRTTGSRRERLGNQAAICRTPSHEQERKVARGRTEIWAVQSQ